MPADAQTTTDYRPYGAAAGASLPTLGVLEYLLKTRPEILRKMKDAPDWTLANGDIDVARAVRTLRPGDFGVAGLQTTNDKHTNFLVRGSAIASGGPGAHGQVVGANLQSPYEWSYLPQSGPTTDLPFLMNERGELYSMDYGENYEKIHDIRARRKAWDDYDAARAAGKPATKPDSARPSDKEVKWFVDALTGKDVDADDVIIPSDHTRALGYGKHKETIRYRARRILELQKQMGPEEVQRLRSLKPKERKAIRLSKEYSPAKEWLQLRKEQGRVSTAKRDGVGAVDLFRNYMRRPELRAFFEQQPNAEANAALSRVLRNSAGAATEEAAVRSARLQKLLPLAEQFETRGPRGKQIAESIRAAVAEGPKASRLPRFNPKKYETFIPTLHHGGIAGAGIDPYALTASNIRPAIQEAIEKRSPSHVLKTLQDTLGENAKLLQQEAEVIRQNPHQIYQPHYTSINKKNWIDSVFNATAQDGSRMRPAEFADTATYGPGGPRATTWARFKTPPPAQKLHEGLARNAASAYAGSHATGAGIKEVLGLNSLRRLIPGLGVSKQSPPCWGNHCGSLPGRVFAETGNIKKPKLPFMDTLPATYLANPDVEIVGIANKARAMKDFSRLARGRVGAGLGAAGLMGALGYGATHLAGGKPRPIAPPKPVYDPRLVQAVKALFPQQTQSNFNRI